MSARRWQRPSWFAIALTALGIALFLSLGLWQLGRMREKRALLDTAAALLNERKSVPLVDAAWDVARAHAYDWVSGTGTFADRQPVLLDNQIRNGRVGVRVYRVFNMDKTVDSVNGSSMGGSILIDLGWLQLAANRELPKLRFPLPNKIEVRSFIAPPPSSGMA